MVHMEGSTIKGNKNRTAHQTAIQYGADGSMSLTRYDGTILSKQAITNQEIRKMQQLLREFPRRLALHLREATYITLAAVLECGTEEEKDIAKMELERRKREETAAERKAEIESRMAQKKGNRHG
ncbi:hypothetical protein M1397_02220 [Candidatus Marsarchaeota archaeon]|nr:hypothetical protein [Candidatus Marsarchaeota archaeon]